MNNSIVLNNGVRIPSIGLGVFQSPPEETVGAVEAALAIGYRLIDTAAAYGNERQVGEAVRGSGLVRSEVFLETPPHADFDRRERRQATGPARRTGDATAGEPARVAGRSARHQFAGSASSYDAAILAWSWKIDSTRSPFGASVSH